MKNKKNLFFIVFSITSIFSTGKWGLVHGNPEISPHQTKEEQAAKEITLALGSYGEYGVGVMFESIQEWKNQSLEKLLDHTKTLKGGFKNKDYHLSAQDMSLLQRYIENTLKIRSMEKKPGKKPSNKDPRFLALCKKWKPRYRALRAKHMKDLWVNQHKLVVDNVEKMNFEEAEKLYWGLRFFVSIHERNMSPRDKAHYQKCLELLEQAMEPRTREERPGIHRDINMVRLAGYVGFNSEYEVFRPYATLGLILEDTYRNGSIPHVEEVMTMNTLLEGPENFIGGSKGSSKSLAVIKKNMKAYFQARKSGQKYTPDEDFMALGEKLYAERITRNMRYMDEHPKESLRDLGDMSPYKLQKLYNTWQRAAKEKSVVDKALVKRCLKKVRDACAKRNIPCA